MVEPFRATELLRERSDLGRIDDSVEIEEVDVDRGRLRKVDAETLVFGRSRRHAVQIPLSSPVESAKESTGMPIRPSIETKRFASGVPLGALTSRPGSSVPAPPPARMTGRSSWSCRLPRRDRAAVHQHRVVEQRPAGFADRTHLAEQVGEHLALEAVDDADLLDLREIALVVGEVMVPSFTSRKEAPIGTLVGEHEGRDAGLVELEGEDQHVVHQLDVLAVVGRDAFDGCEGGEGLGILLRPLEVLDSSLEGPHPLGVLLHAPAVGRSQFAVETTRVLADVVENRLPRMQSTRALLGGATGITEPEETLEDLARPDLLEVGLGRAAP